MMSHSLHPSLSKYDRDLRLHFVVAANDPQILVAYTAEVYLSLIFVGVWVFFIPFPRLRQHLLHQQHVSLEAEGRKRWQDQVMALKAYIWKWLMLDF